MTKFTDSRFDVAFMGDATYRKNWSRIFAKCKLCYDEGWIETLVGAADRPDIKRCPCTPEGSD